MIKLSYYTLYVYTLSLWYYTTKLIAANAVTLTITLKYIVIYNPTNKITTLIINAGIAFRSNLIYISLPPPI